MSVYLTYAYCSEDVLFVSYHLKKKKNRHILQILNPHSYNLIKIECLLYLLHYNYCSYNTSIIVHFIECVCACVCFLFLFVCLLVCFS